MPIKKQIIARDVSIQQHVKNRTVELGQSLDNKYAIYLDTRYWIILRNGALQEGPARLLLRELQTCVSDGLAFCPLSDSTFSEILKQTDKGSRRRTAEIVDELSLGVSLLTSKQRIATEVARFFYGLVKPEAELIPLKFLVWTKAAYVYGFFHPTEFAASANTESAIQKAFWDEMWSMRLTDMIELIDFTKDDSLTLSAVAEKLNSGILKHSINVRSFQQAWLHELSGTADLCADIAADVVCEISETGGATPPKHGDAQWWVTRNACANAILHVLKDKPQMRKALPTVYIEACLHAAVRWDKMRKLSGNDLYDFQHASAALAHCHAFLTERPLQSSILRLKPKLGQEFSCRVISDIEEAIDFLTDLRKRG